MPDFDVIVIGAGPAGLSAAAAMNGLDVLVVDKKESIGEPVVCAEGTIDRVLEENDIPVTGDHIARKITDVTISWPRGEVLDIHLTRRAGYVLHRDELERLLATRCKATFRMNARAVRIDEKGLSLSNGETYSAPLYIDCAGWNSPIRNQFLPRRGKHDLAICAQHTIRHELELSALEMHVHHELSPLGYVWVFPKEDGVANVGMGVAATTGANPRLAIKEYLDGRFKDYETVRSFGGVVPVGLPIRPPSMGNVMFAGDAANHCMAHTGGGIAMALYCGKVAGECAQGFLRNDCNTRYIKEYGTRLRGVYRKLRRCWRLKEKFLKDPDSIYRVYRIGKRALRWHKRFPDFVEKIALLRLRY